LIIAAANKISYIGRDWFANRVRIKSQLRAASKKMTADSPHDRPPNAQSAYKIVNQDSTLDVS
jgi:hypothetical protein